MTLIRNIALATAAVAAVSASAAYAQSPADKALVDAAKARGAVGEQSDGYLGFVAGGGDPALQSAVRAINTGRAQAYREIAARTGVTPEAAGQAAATQVQQRLPGGQFYKPLNGGWTRK